MGVTLSRAPPLHDITPPWASPSWGGEEQRRAPERSGTPSFSRRHRLAFQRLAVPVGEVGGAVVGRAQEHHQRPLRRRRFPDVGVAQNVLAERRVEDCALEVEFAVGFTEALRLRIGVRIEQRLDARRGAGAAPSAPTNSASRCSCWLFLLALRLCSPPCRGGRVSAPTSCRAMRLRCCSTWLFHISSSQWSHAAICRGPRPLSH